MEYMNDSAVNLTTPEPSTNITGSAFQPDMISIFLMSGHFMFGLPINCYVIWLIATRTGNGFASEFFNLNLCISGILFSLDSFFSVLEQILKFEYFAKLSSFFQYLVMGHPQFQCLMCVERYLAVVQPVTFLKYKPLRYRVICSIVVWIFALASCLFFMLNDINIYTWIISVDFLMVFSIQVFCLAAVLRALKQSGPGERKKEKEENHMKRRAFNLILITTLNTFIMYLPSAIFGLIGVIHMTIPILNYFHFVCFTLPCFVQPVLYLHRSGKISCFQKSNCGRLFACSSCFYWMQESRRWLFVYLERSTSST